MAQSLAYIIKKYKRFKKRYPDSWIAHCQSQQTLPLAIHVASLSQNAAGQKHPHQYRLRKNDLKAFERQLLQSMVVINKAQNFDSLHTIVKQNAPKGIGPLAIYDTAVRIGAFLNLSPDHIYLHAGTREGAKKLIPNLTENTIDKNHLPAPLRNSNLNCYELEDLLCIYKDEF